MNIFCDIDGTLTFAPLKTWGEPNFEAIRKLKQTIETGKYRVFVWSGGGYEYAKAFVAKYEINAIPLPKPDIYIDDNKKIRPKYRMKHILPEDFLTNGLSSEN